MVGSHRPGGDLQESGKVWAADYSSYEDRCPSHPKRQAQQVSLETDSEQVDRGEKLEN